MRRICLFRGGIAADQIGLPKRSLAGVVSTAVLASVLLYGCFWESASDRTAVEEPIVLPDFAAIKDVQVKKTRFFSFVQPFVEKENRRILAQRQRLEDLFSAHQKGDRLKSADRDWLVALASDYKMDDQIKPSELLQEKTYTQLLRRVDSIPLELALVQAANESAWGTSRFARLGNNLFGQWCFTKGCGLVPNQRAAGAVHEVAVFPSLQASVAGYMENLNTGASYRLLRDIRRQQRLAGKAPSGHELAAGLEKYSSRGQHYIKELRTMMRENRNLIQSLSNKSPASAGI